MNVWASIILWSDSSLAGSRIVKENAQERVTIAFVHTLEDAIDAAVQLADQGTELIELCGGFGLGAGAKVVRAVGDRAAVGAVMFGIDSITRAASYKAKFDAAEKETP